MIPNRNINYPNPIKFGNGRIKDVVRYVSLAEDDIYAALVLNNFIASGSTLMVRREVLGAVGGGRQVAIERGLAAHRHRLARRRQRPVVAAVRGVMQPARIAAPEVLGQQGLVGSGEVGDGGDVQ